MSACSSVQRSVRLLILGGFGLTLAACANPRAESAIQAQQALIGMPKKTLLSCAGVPNRTATVDNLEFYTYTNQRTVAYSTGPALGMWGVYPWPSYYGYGWGYPYGPDYYGVESETCEATFTLRNGVVERLVFGGTDTSVSSRLSQCYSIVENCLAMAPAAGAPLPSPGVAPTG